MNREELYQIIEGKTNTIVGAAFAKDFMTVRKQMAEAYKEIAEKLKLEPDKEPDKAMDEILNL